MKAIALLLAILWPASLVAQVMPQASNEASQVQTVQFAPGARVLLTMLPDTPITVMLEPGRTITDVAAGNGDDFKVRVAADRNSLMVLPTPAARAATLDVSTRDRRYSFMLRVEQSYSAALLVRFIDDDPASYENGLAAPEAPVSEQTWHYRLRGDREVRPADIWDDGYKTRISYQPGQALPAVFAIGPTGEEEVVNGYMRGEVFVIDRVYGELVFRIDREKATARRNEDPEAAS